jgi:hypothetical protein
MTYKQALEIPIGTLVTSKTTGEVVKIIDKDILSDGKNIKFTIIPEGTPKIPEVWNHKHACLLRRY